MTMKRINRVIDGIDDKCEELLTAYMNAGYSIAEAFKRFFRRGKIETKPEPYTGPLPEFDYIPEDWATVRRLQAEQRTESPRILVNGTQGIYFGPVLTCTPDGKLVNVPRWLDGRPITTATIADRMIYAETLRREE